MSGQGPSQLIKMVNQISANIAHDGDDDKAAERVATHLQKFWARSMKEQIIAYADDGNGDGDSSELTPLSKRAVARLKEARKAG